jgi:hypothetical protein
MLLQLRIPVERILDHLPQEVHILARQHLLVFPRDRLVLRLGGLRLRPPSSRAEPQPALGVLLVDLQFGVCQRRPLGLEELALKVAVLLAPVGSPRIEVEPCEPRAFPRRPRTAAAGDDIDNVRGERWVEFPEACHDRCLKDGVVRGVYSSVHYEGREVK